MKRQRIGRVAAIFLVALSVAGFGAPANAQAPAELPLNECIDKRQALSVLFLVDTSLSLRRSDPTDTRVDGLKLAVAALASRRDSEAGSSVPTFVDFLSFGTRTNRTFSSAEWPEWGEIPADPTALLARLDKFRDEDAASDTDYVSALEPYPSGPPADADQLGALEHLSAAPTSCRLLVWFTDGKLDFDPPAPGLPPKVLSWTNLQIANEAHAVQAATEGTDRLCAAGGPSDRLRGGSIDDKQAGAQVAVVALGNNQDDFNLIRRIAESDCGTKSPRGKLYPANDVNSLVGSLLDATLGEGDGPAGDEISTCSGASCDSVEAGKIESFDYPFTLTAGIDSFNLIALKGDTRITSILVSPDGQRLPLDDIRSTVTMDNGTTVEPPSLPWAPTVQLVRAKLGDNPNAWAGQWRLRFKTADAQAAAALNRVNLYVYPGDLTLQLRDPEVVRRGRTSSMVIELATTGGRLIAKPDFMPDPDLSVSVNGIEVDPGELRSDGTWQFDYDVDSDLPDEELSLDAELVLRAQIDPSRDPIELERLNFDDFAVIEVKDLPKYPLIDAPVEPFDDDLNQNRTSVTSKLLIEAPAEAESGGCVELIDATAAADPDGTFIGAIRVLDGDREITVGDPCSIELKSGEQKSLTIEVGIDGDDVSEQQTLLTGTLKFRSTSASDPSQSGEYEKTVTASVVPEFVTDTDWPRVILLTILAVLGPFLVLYALNFLGKTIDVGPGASVTIPVRFAGNRLYRRDGASTQGFRIDDEDLDIVGMPPPGRYRSTDIGGVSFAGRMSWSPFADIAGSARTGAAGFVVANHGTDPRDIARGRLSPSVKDAWVFHADTAPMRTGDRYEDVDGFITMVVPSDPELARSSSRERMERICDTIGDSCMRHAVEPAPLEEPNPPLTPRFGGRAEGATDPLAAETASTTLPDPIDPLGGGSSHVMPIQTFSAEETKPKRRWGSGRSSASDDSPTITPPTPPNTPF